MGEADTETRHLMGECASYGKSVSKSNMAKHRKVCETKKLSETRKVSNAISREKIVKLSDMPLDVEPMREKKMGGGTKLDPSSRH
ncbi:hypothetical protein GN244_ATG10158 [Phytophthora infestans]|uniref:Uncharacterized protein n=1 Tax=Phytophthora infestans TaxID=4787 RepID=A0A833WCY7_PHYIN|nr:hypothetical protein GN244_ATG10158 [Phytophthora infestans]